MLNSEIERLVKERIERETVDLRSTVIALQQENAQLKEDMKSSVSKPEVAMSAKIDDLERYSRRSCLRVAGIDESENENTDDIVLGLANRLKVDVGRHDIDRSHRVGPLRRDLNNSVSADSHDDSEPKLKPMEIIVKFRNSSARLALLKGRATLRKKKEKIFINEDLTQSRRSLSFQCRQLKRENKIQKTWVYNGTFLL